MISTSRLFLLLLTPILLSSFFLVSSPAFAVDGIKSGNNGTVSCDTYCTNPGFGGWSNTCSWGYVQSYDVNALIPGGVGWVSESCLCFVPGVGNVEKAGNNGTVSCTTYCGNAIWGGFVGTAVSSRIWVNCGFLWGGNLLPYCTTTATCMSCGCGAVPAPN